MLIETGALAFLCFSFASQGFSQLANQNTGETGYNFFWLPHDIVSDIRSGKFYDANTKIIQFRLPLSSIENIIEFIYDKNISNLDLLRNLSETSNDIPTNYAVLTFLWQEMKANGNMDLYDMTIMYQKFCNKVTNQEHITNDVKTKAEVINGIMRNDIITIAAATLRAAVLDRNSTSSYKIQWVVVSLQAIDEKITDDTVRKVVVELLPEISVQELIRALSSFKRISQSLTVLVSIADHLNATNNLYGIAAMQLADKLGRLQKTTPYKTISQNKKKEVERLVSQLPVSIRNLYLSTKLCMRNEYYYEYLNSPIDFFKMDDDRRFVYTSSGKSDTQAHWYKKKYVDNEFGFEFCSDYNRYEYLYASELTRCNKLCHVAMTWVPGGGLELKSVWHVESIADRVFLRNLHFNELLCLDDERSLQNKRFVLTQKPEDTTDILKCQWNFESC